jgi:hypothetical protein
MTPATHSVVASWAGPRKVAIVPEHLRLATRERWLLLTLLLTPLCSSTFLAKLAVPPFGAMGLGIDIPMTLATALIGMLMGRFTFHTGRLVFYLLMVSWIGMVHVLRGDLFSPTSVLLLVGLYAPFVLKLRDSASPQPDAEVDGALRFMGQLGAFFAACGIAQYAAQFAVGVTYAFPLENFLPSGFLIQTFNYLNPLGYGSNIFKANGIFFLEPSFFSQFTALGLLLELSLWNRRGRILLYLAALAITFSGTGIIVMIAGVAVLVLVKQRWDIIALGVLVAILLVFLAEPLNLNLFTSRASEFESTRSSGFERFVAWTYMFEQHWWPDNMRVLFGAGAGSFVSFANISRYNAAGMAFSKMFFEFGVTGGLLYFGFLFYAIYSIRAPVAFKVGLTACLFLNGSYTGFTSGILLSTLLWPMASRQAPPKPPTTSVVPRRASR